MIFARKASTPKHMQTWNGDESKASAEKVVHDGAEEGHYLWRPVLPFFSWVYYILIICTSQVSPL